MEKKTLDTIKFIVFALFGSFMFFIPVDFNGVNTIPVDHIVKAITAIPGAIPVIGIIIITVGAILPFVKKTWNSSPFVLFTSIMGILGVIFAIMVLLNVGPESILRADVAPFIFNRVAVPVIIIVPIGSIFLAFLIDYGLMEFIGVFARPFMTKIFDVPGRAAVDAVSSFVGSYSLALLITNGAYRDGKYTAREAAIIATGFSTVSATFMIIVANTLGIMDHWLTFFWVSLVVTFAVTAITAKLYPLKKMPNEYFQGVEPNVESTETGNYFKRAYAEGMEVIANANSVPQSIYKNFKDGVRLALNIGPSIMGVGTAALLLAYYTPVFDYLGYIFLPLTTLLRIPEPLIMAKGMAVSISEMYIPAILGANAPIITKFIIAVLTISEILFFSASIPCIMATDIPIKIKDIVIIWFERVILTVIITTPIAFMLFS